MALVAGLLSLTSWSSDSNEAQAAQRNLKPFKEAVDDLANAPGLRYKDTSSLGITENEITVTASGSQFGTTSSGRNSTGKDDNAEDVLRIGGKTFMRWHVDPSPREDVAAGEEAPPSEWMVGLDDGSDLTDEALARTIAPSELANVLAKALASLEKSPQVASESKTTAGQQPLSVNGTPALGIDTSAGRLLVTKKKPHRVLRLEAYDLREGLSDMKDQLENGEEPTAPPKVTTGPLESGDGEGMDLTPILADAAHKMFDTLVKYAAQLKDATDHGINFTMDSAGEMDCSSSGCTATQNFTGEVSSIARKERVTKGEVTAVMSATFSIDGKPAGQCTSPQRTFPVRGNSVSGTLQCSNPGAGPLYASVSARNKTQANARAQACSCKVTLSYPLRANTFIDARALAAVEAKQLVEQAQRERRDSNCVQRKNDGSQATSQMGGFRHASYTSTDTATPVGGCTSRLVSDGTAATATVTPQKLLADAKALHDTFGVGTRADKGTTVATAQLGGELVYAVARNGTNAKLAALAESRGYRRAYDPAMAQGLTSDAEQILFNLIDEKEYAGDGIIASSRPACGLTRRNGQPAQNCAGRAQEYPGVQLWEQQR
ncbi:hypothetical protein OH736_45465 (plasmid) [Streptomyces sp. NBC_01650]|uniref:hypothetical protein n=1 Tax=Streptomyces sp. NBC_01650 TaxID=2975907 RepID=UPI0038676D1A|nr:hypothetical protein OH736_45465 [Streptomyces sp. NBC_01650]